MQCRIWLNNKSQNRQVTFFGPLWYIYALFQFQDIVLIGQRVNFALNCFHAMVVFVPLCVIGWQYMYVRYILNTDNDIPRCLEQCITNCVPCTLVCCARLHVCRETGASSMCIVWCINASWSKQGGRKNRESRQKTQIERKQREIVKSGEKWSFFRSRGMYQF